MNIKTKGAAILFLLFISSIIYSQAPDYPFAHPKGYVCYKSLDSINVDGFLAESVWELAEWSDPFTDITGYENVQPYLDTRVKMLWDDSNFYIAAKLLEPNLWGSITQRDNVIFKDNDFEVFIDPDGDNHHYYELEINVLNTVWDLILTKAYRDGGAAIDNYDFKGLQTGVAPYGTIDESNDIDEKWCIEIAIPWHNFEVWNPKRSAKTPKDGEQWRVNFSRVQWELEATPYSYTKKLDHRGNLLPENNWVWSPQGLVSMHQPETWGYVQFSEKAAGSEKVDFIQDLDFNLKMALMDVYFQQKRYYKQHQTYTENINELQLSTFNKNQFSNKIIIETLSNRFIAYAKGDTGVWQIDEHSKITKIH